MKEHIRIAVCDDMSNERRNIINMVERYIDTHEYVAEIHEYPSGETLLAALSGSSKGEKDENDSHLAKITSDGEKQYDLIILDIIMDEINGIETAKKVNELLPSVQIIFCSTSNEYAAESYDVAALRYLTKPVEEEKLFRTLDIYFHAHKAMRMLTYKQNRMDESIYVSEILWIEAGDHKSIIHTKHGDIVTSSVQKQLSKQLDGMDFVKPIRHALVSLSAVVTVPSDVMTLSDGTRIPIARNARGEMKQAFTDYKMKTLLRKGGML